MNEVADFVENQDRLSPLEIRGKIDELERAILSLSPELQLEIPPTHYQAEGLYAREILIPRGTVLTGKIHKFQHINVISQGDISVMTEHGIKRLKAPCTFVSPPGTKRVGYAHEDTVWTTFHATEETDLSQIEDALVFPSEHQLVHEMKELEAKCPS